MVSFKEVARDEDQSCQLLTPSRQPRASAQYVQRITRLESADGRLGFGSWVVFLDGIQSHDLSERDSLLKVISRLVPSSQTSEREIARQTPDHHFQADRPVFSGL